MKLYQVKEDNTSWTDRYRLTFIIQSSKHTTQIINDKLKLDREYVITQHRNTIDLVYKD